MGEITHLRKRKGFERFSGDGVFYTVVPLEVLLQTDVEVTDNKAKILVARLLLKSAILQWVDTMGNILQHDFRFPKGNWFKSALG